MLGFPPGSDGKEFPCNVWDRCLIPGLGRSPGGGHGNLLQYSSLENPHGQRSLVIYSPWACEESDTTEWLSTNMRCSFKWLRLCTCCILHLPGTFSPGWSLSPAPTGRFRAAITNCCRHLWPAWMLPEQLYAYASHLPLLVCFSVCLKPELPEGTPSAFHSSAVQWKYHGSRICNLKFFSSHMIKGKGEQVKVILIIFYVTQ